MNTNAISTTQWFSILFDLGNVIESHEIVSVIIENRLGATVASEYLEFAGEQ